MSEKATPAVKRWKRGTVLGYSTMVEDADGDWVHHEDAAAEIERLAAELAEERARVERLRNSVDRLVGARIAWREEEP